MTKQRLSRTPLAAVIGLLAFLVVPAAAQAHHVDSKAECVLVGGQPTLRLTATFVEFNSTHSVTGKVLVDGQQKFAGTVPVVWNGDNGTWVYTQAATAGTSYAVQTQWTWTGGSDGEQLSTGPCPAPPQPAIALDKTGAATATAGSTFTYSFKATNTGPVTLTNVTLTDDRCQSTLTRAEPNLADPTFDPGDEWFFTCTVTAPAGPAQVDNTAKVCGDYQPGGQAPPVTVCDEDTHTFTVPPGETPPGTTPDTGTPPGSGVLPETLVSGRAVLHGPSGCVKQAFRARVTGRSIASVTFYVDGARVKRINGSRSVYALKVHPRRFGFGRHRVIARVEFTAESGTPARRLPLTFRRCAQGAVAPRFTG